MDRTERFYRIRRRLIDKGALTRREIEEELEISHATFKRDIEYLRDRLNMPIVWSRARQGYVLDPEAEVSELSGGWFSPAESYALLEIEHLLGSLSPGLLGSRLEPLRQRLAELLERGDRGHSEIRRRIRVIGPGTRRVNREVFEAVSLGLLGRRQVFIRHLRRGDGAVTERAVSPQRLVHYRYNWYLDAWCHLRRDLRVFSVDAIRTAAVREEAAREVAEGALDRVLGAGYGIFAGATTETPISRRRRRPIPLAFPRGPSRNYCASRRRRRAGWRTRPGIRGRSAASRPTAATAWNCPTAASRNWSWTCCGMAPASRCWPRPRCANGWRGNSPWRRASTPESHWAATGRASRAPGRCARARPLTMVSG